MLSAVFANGPMWKHVSRDTKQCCVHRHALISKIFIQNILHMFSYNPVIAEFDLPPYKNWINIFATRSQRANAGLCENMSRGTPSSAVSTGMLYFKKYLYRIFYTCLATTQRVIVYKLIDIQVSNVFINQIEINCDFILTNQRI